MRAGSPIETLEVHHILKKNARARPVSAPDFFLFESCQRYVWIGFDQTKSIHENSEKFSGTEAYFFLLKLACGLESEVLGETDVFGQLKDAWQTVKSKNPRLQKIFQNIFEDAKEVRSRYLQKLGGSSYGSLVRKLIANKKDPILLVGAGHLARSITPYLSDREIWLTNRSAEKLAKFHEEFLEKSHARMKKIGASEESSAWKNAATVLICTPKSERDPEWIELRKSSGNVVHLGVLRNDAGVWAETPGFLCLDDLFDLEKSQNDLRSTRIDRAIRACHERAILRSLGPSISIPHGWEDLAVFA